MSLIYKPIYWVSIPRDCGRSACFDEDTADFGDGGGGEGSSAEPSLLLLAAKVINREIECPLAGGCNPHPNYFRPMSKWTDDRSIDQKRILDVEVGEGGSQREKKGRKDGSGRRRAGLDTADVHASACVRR